MIFCSISNCNTHTDDMLSFFRFPKDYDRCNIWLLNCRHVRKPQMKNLSSVELHKNFRICSNHFTNDQFTNSLKNRLKRRAVPTIFNVDPDNNEGDDENVEDVENDEDVKNVDVKIENIEDVENVEDVKNVKDVKIENVKDVKIENFEYIEGNFENVEGIYGDGDDVDATNLSFKLDKFK